MIIPGLKDWMEGTFGANLQHKTQVTVSAIFSIVSPANGSTQQLKPHCFYLFQPLLNTSAVHPPTLNEAFVEELKSTGIPFSHEAEDRVFRAHGKK